MAKSLEEIIEEYNGLKARLDVAEKAMRTKESEADKLVKVRGKDERISQMESISVSLDKALEDVRKKEERAEGYENLSNEKYLTPEDKKKYRELALKTREKLAKAREKVERLTAQKGKITITDAERDEVYSIRSRMSDIISALASNPEINDFFRAKFEYEYGKRIDRYSANREATSKEFDELAQEFRVKLQSPEYEKEIKALKDAHEKRKTITATMSTKEQIAILQMWDDAIESLNAKIEQEKLLGNITVTEQDFFEIANGNFVIPSITDAKNKKVSKIEKKQRLLEDKRDKALSDLASLRVSTGPQMPVIPDELQGRIDANKREEEENDRTIRAKEQEIQAVQDEIDNIPSTPINNHTDEIENIKKKIEKIDKEIADSGSQLANIQQSIDKINRDYNDNDYDEDRLTELEEASLRDEQLENDRQAEIKNISDTYVEKIEELAEEGYVSSEIIPELDDENSEIYSLYEKYKDANKKFRKVMLDYQANPDDTNKSAVESAITEYQIASGNLSNKTGFDAASWNNLYLRELLAKHKSGEQIDECFQKEILIKKGEIVEKTHKIKASTDDEVKAAYDDFSEAIEDLDKLQFDVLINNIESPDEIENSLKGYQDASNTLANKLKIDLGTLLSGLKNIAVNKGKGILKKLASLFKRDKFNPEFCYGPEANRENYTLRIGQKEQAKTAWENFQNKINESISLELSDEDRAELADLRNKKNNQQKAKSLLSVERFSERNIEQKNRSLEETRKNLVLRKEQLEKDNSSVVDQGKLQTLRAKKQRLQDEKDALERNASRIRTDKTKLEDEVRSLPIPADKEKISNGSSIAFVPGKSSIIKDIQKSIEEDGRN